MYSAEEADRLRGPQHEIAWCDEIASWKEPDTWDMLQFGMRLGPRPQTVITTTPKATPFVKRLMKLPGLRITRGSMLDNRKNLPDTFIQAILDRYQGTRLGKQEIEGMYLDAVEGAIFREADIMRRKDGPKPVDDYDRVCVAVDPARRALWCVEATTTRNMPTCSKMCPVTTSQTSGPKSQSTCTTNGKQIEY
jgi:phage terminase large subunit-like protein